MTAKVPPTPDFNTPDAGLGRWVAAVNIALKALRDAKLITQDDIDDLTRKANETLSTKRATSASDVVVGLGGVIPITDLVDKLVANQQFKDAIKTTPTSTSSAGGGTSSTALSTLEQGLQEATRLANQAIEAASSAASGVQQLKANTRGPISSVGVYGYWDDTMANLCIYWMRANGGTGATPPLPIPTDPTSYLVIGDRVTLRDTTAEPCTWFETRQYLGSVIGWVATPHSVDFNDVINLGRLLTSVSTVINTALGLVKTTAVTGGNLQPGTGGVIANPTLAQIINQFDFNVAGTQAYNTLQALIAIEARLTAHGI